jgi:hypothetical protein
LPECGLGVGDQNFSELGIASHLAELAIVGHIRGVLFWKCNQRGLSSTVEPRTYAHARRRRWAVAMQMRDNDRAAIELDYAETPWHAFAKEQLETLPQHCLRNQITRAILLAPVEAMGKAGITGFARRILDCSAFTTDLQLEAAAGRRRGQSERDTTANARRERRNARSQDRVLTRWPY